jgi:hypothetical protein
MNSFTKIIFVDLALGFGFYIIAFRDKVHLAHQPEKRTHAFEGLLLLTCSLYVFLGAVIEPLGLLVRKAQSLFDKDYKQRLKIWRLSYQSQVLYMCHPSVSTMDRLSSYAKVDIPTGKQKMAVIEGSKSV